MINAFLSTVNFVRIIIRPLCAFLSWKTSRNRWKKKCYELYFCKKYLIFQSLSSFESNLKIIIFLGVSILKNFMLLYARLGFSLIIKAWVNDVIVNCSTLFQFNILINEDICSNINFQQNWDFIFFIILVKDLIP